MPALPTLRRWFITALIISLGISALIAIFVFIFGDFEDTEGNALLTTLSVSLFSLTGLGSAAPLGRARWPLFSYLGLSVSVAGFIVFLPGIWAHWVDIEGYGESMASVAIFSLSFAQANLLSMVRLHGRARLLFPATLVVILVLASLASAVIAAGDYRSGYLRAVAVLAVVDAFGTVTIPLLSRLTPVTDTKPDPRKGQVEIRCPRCSAFQWLEQGGALCRKCSLRITVAAEEDRC